MSLRIRTVKGDSDSHSAVLSKLSTSFLGRGSFASVYRLSAKRVVKVVQRDDKGYMSWLKWVLEHQHNPHVPKIYMVVYFTQAPDRPIVIMEKLEQINYNSADLCDKFDHFTQVIGNATCCRSPDPHIRELWDGIKDVTSNHYDDIGGNNVMMRGETFVITDPVC